MADITPYDLTATLSIASSGDEIIFTWKWDPTPQHNVESLAGSRGYLFQQLDSSGNVIRSVRTAASLTNPQTKLAFPGYPYDPYYLEYRVYATEWQWDSANAGNEPLLGGPSNVARVYDSRRPTEPEQPEPTTPAAGRLEQFQNRAGTNIYPRTVMEGVFRQSDGKNLEELLVILEEDKEQGIPADGSAGQVLTKQSSADYDTAWKPLVTYGTSDLTAGSSSLANGQIHLVYE